MKPTTSAVLPVLRRLLAGHRPAVIVAVLVAAAASALALIQPLIAGRIVDAASHGALTAGPTALLAAVFLSAIITEAYSSYLFTRLGENVVFAQRSRYAAHLIALPVADLDAQRLGDLLARGTADTTELQEFPRRLSRISIGLLTLAAAIALMVHVDPILGLTVITIVSAAFVLGSLLLARVQAAATSRQAAIGEYGARMERTLSAIRTVKIYGAQALHEASIDQAADMGREAGLRMGRLGMLATPVVRIAATGSLVIVLVVGGSRVASGDITIGGMVSLFLFTMYSLGPLQDVYDGLTSVRRAVGANERIEDILRLQPEPIDVQANIEAPVYIAPQGREYPAVATMGVSFSYGDQKTLVDVSFELQRNQITALVGPSGGGKSTLLALLCRFYEPTTGELYCDGHPYLGQTLSTVRRRIALVEQDNPILHGTLRDNLVMGCPTATDAQIWTVLEQVNLADTVEKLPQGLDTNALDRGRALSGGQRQRLAIARALLSPAELILLDEPTAHLDHDNESAIMETLMEQRGERTVLVVAHRLTTVRQADQLLYIENGHLLAQGTHHELLEESGDYRRLLQEGKLEGGHRLEPTDVG